MTIGKGTTDGLRPDMAVLAPAGVVGPRHRAQRRARPRCSCWSTATPPSARSSSDRASQGVAIGAATIAARWSTSAAAADVKVGDSIVTSGIDGIYPKGFVIGRIEKVERAGGAYRSDSRAAGRGFRAAWRTCWSC